MSDEYKCAICKDTFKKERTEEEAKEQLKEEFPGFEPEDCELVCDDCYKTHFEVEKQTEEEPYILHSWMCVRNNVLRVIMGHLGDIIHTEKWDCDCPTCTAKMNQISKEQIG